jgi:pSer/pThr/pTyr-binding forkhead associated (FHA) protein
MKTPILNFKCKHCSTKLELRLKDDVFNTTQHIRCFKCGKITSVKIKEKEKYIKDATKIEDEAKKTNIISVNTKQASVYLIIEENEFTKNQSFEIDQAKMTLGRKNTAGPKAKPDVEINTEDMYMSKIHAQIIRKKNNDFVIIDNDSTNGTWLNDEKLKPYDEFYLENNDIIRLGRTSINVKIKES